MNGLLNEHNLLGDGLRFVLVGVGNTLLTLLIFQALLFHLSPLVSYYVSWAIGLAVLITAFPRYVFKGSALTAWRAVLTVVIYLISVLSGGWLLNQLTALGIMPRVGILMTVAFTTIFNFAASRLVFRLSRLNVV